MFMKVSQTCNVGPSFSNRLRAGQSEVANKPKSANPPYKIVQKSTFRKLESNFGEMRALFPARDGPEGGRLRALQA